jgi:hypothetical protein
LREKHLQVYELSSHITELFSEGGGKDSCRGVCLKYLQDTILIL